MSENAITALQELYSRFKGTDNTSHFEKLVNYLLEAITKNEFVFFLKAFSRSFVTVSPHIVQCFIQM